MIQKVAPDRDHPEEETVNQAQAPRTAERQRVEEDEKDQHQLKPKNPSLAGRDPSLTRSLTRKERRRRKKRMYLGQGVDPNPENPRKERRNPGPGVILAKERKIPKENQDQEAEQTGDL